MFIRFIQYFNTHYRSKVKTFTSIPWHYNLFAFGVLWSGSDCF